MTRLERAAERKAVTALKHLDRAARALREEIFHRKPKPRRASMRVLYQIDKYFDKLDGVNGY